MGSVADDVSGYIIIPILSYSRGHLAYTSARARARVRDHTIMIAA